MIIVKLFVSFVSVNLFRVCVADYCEICTNHTMCKLINPGPGPECQSYDSTALLTRHDISQLMNKINERRNFVAMGYSKILPQAANMKKINWSPKLATFAQRWADQCNQFTRPDKEDQCRDLESLKVGQNIASVIGPALGLNVRSFVETWFIQVLEYTGSVMYYNESRDYKSNYFTQLIWADTEYVGCSKVKFYVKEKDTMLERLVCNFAPKGNNHGKPVYAIGYAATQCTNNMIPDKTLKGLCTYNDNENLRKLQTPGPPGSSLLRILNLSNNSVKQEIDPIHNILKQINIHLNGSREQRNQKTRHVFSNNSYPALKHSPLRKQNFWKSLINMSRNDDEYLYQQERGHSHVYHGHDTPRSNYGSNKDENTKQDFRRYDYTTDSINSYSNANYRKYYNQYQQCTRRKGTVQNDCTTMECSPNHCTRGIIEGCQQTTTCQTAYREIPFTYPVINHIVPHDLCPCTTKQTCPRSPNNCNCNTNCRCLNIPYPTKDNCFITPCPRIHRMQDKDFKDDTRKSGTYLYEDVMPNIRSGGESPKEEKSLPKEIPWSFNQRINKSFQKTFENKETDQMQKPIQDVISQPQYPGQDSDYLYRPFDKSVRKRRQLGDQINPFWQMDEVNYRKLPQLKSLRYTTIGNKKNRRSRKQMGSLNPLVSTEPITIPLEDVTDDQVGIKPHVTEKYLSFDELLHLRKFSNVYGDYDSRRGGAKKATTKAVATTKKSAVTTKTTTKTTKTTKKAITTKVTSRASTATTATSEVTTNTPFERKKHCTRKLTCTWTAFTATASDGSMIGPGGGQLDMGSRTPPGYVDGCTRTSTCTRDNMNRNKMSTLPIDGTDSIIDEGEPKPPPDDDYCERRSLNVRRRNSDDKDIVVAFDSYSVETGILSAVSSKLVPTLNIVLDTETEVVPETNDCVCSEESARKKRQEQTYLRSPARNDNLKEDFSYGELYYLVLNKMIKERQITNHQRKNCQCNSTNKIKNKECLLCLFVSLMFEILSL